MVSQKSNRQDEDTHARAHNFIFSTRVSANANKFHSLLSSSVCVFNFTLSAVPSKRRRYQLFCSMSSMKPLGKTPFRCSWCSMYPHCVWWWSWWWSWWWWRSLKRVFNYLRSCERFRVFTTFYHLISITGLTSFCLGTNKKKKFPSVSRHPQRCGFKMRPQALTSPPCRRGDRICCSSFMKISYLKYTRAENFNFREDC